MTSSRRRSWSTRSVSTACRARRGDRSSTGSDTMRNVEDDDSSARPGDDLRRILGYEDAVNDEFSDVGTDPVAGIPEELRCVGQDLFVTPFWTPEFCDTIVRAA